MFIYLSDKITEKITRKRLDIFLQKHATDEKVLEIGAKNRPYKKYFPNAWATDITKGPDINQIVDAHQLPFAASSFKTVLCTEVLEHCCDPAKVISEIHRVLKPKGKLILTTRFIFPLHDTPYDYFRFTKYGLKYLCKDFGDVEIIEEAGTMETMGVLWQRIAFQSKILFKIPIINIFLHLLAKLTGIFSFLISEEYGDIKKSQKENNILASGYYVIAIK